MSEAEKGKLDRDLRDAERDLTRRANEFQEDVNVRRNEELSRVQRVVLQEVANYAKANGYDLVLADGVLYATQALDVTGPVLQALVSAKPAAPAAAPAKPAGKAN